MDQKISVLSLDKLKQLEKEAVELRGSILKMTTLAKSGHPGGSLSTLDLMWVLYNMIRLSPKEPGKVDRDRVIVSHGHVSPCVYSVLAKKGFFDLDEAIAGFRKAGSVFEGHIEPIVPGVEWATGNLGQGLSAGIGFALACKQRKTVSNIFVFMGDGEQSKGQISEARKFAAKYNLENITVIIDYNQLQISGTIEEVLPNNISKNYKADEWEVFEINGHDYRQIHQAYLDAVSSRKPCMILAKTIMGKGISFMENKNKYHGAPVSEKQLEEGLTELGLDCDLDLYKQKRELIRIARHEEKVQNDFEFQTGSRFVYDESTDCRTAWGNALADLVSLNMDRKHEIAVFDCDLQGSVKTADFEKKLPDHFYQGGITEHNVATIAGAMSKENIQVFFADFGVFGVDETYNQHRLNDINNTNLKVVVTHVGLDVGEDGKTHHCIDYLGVFRNLYNFKIIVPGCPNQTDAIIRYVFPKKGNYLIAMGRSKLDVLKNEQGEIIYDQRSYFEYGKMDCIRKGNDAALLAIGSMVPKALRVYEILKEKGIEIDVWNVSCPFELDISSLQNAAEKGVFFTYEDHNIYTGMGNSVAEKIVELGLDVRLHKFGVKGYSISGSSNEVYLAEQLDESSIAEKIKTLI